MNEDQNTNIYYPDVSPYKLAIQIDEGGTGANSPKQACDNLDILSFQDKDVPNGWASINQEGLIDKGFFPSISKTYIPTLIGPSVVYPNNPVNITISNYSLFENYFLTTNTGDVSRDKDIITFTYSGVGTPSITINDRVITFTTDVAYISKPTLTINTNLVGGLYGPSPTAVVTTPINIVGSSTDTYQKVRYQLAEDPQFNNLIQTWDNISIWTDPYQMSSLIENKDYYVRAAYYGNSIGAGEWSDVVSFRTTSYQPYMPVVTSPVNFATNLGQSVIVTASTYSSPINVDIKSSLWEIATDPGFNNNYQSQLIVNNVMGVINDPTTWTFTGLLVNTTYYVRVRYTDLDNRDSALSTATRFTTTLSFKPYTPTILSPTYGCSTDAVIGTSSTLNVSSSIFSSASGDSVKSVQYQLSTDNEFSVIVSNYVITAPNASLYIWSLYNLQPNTLYYLRVRQEGLNTGWSDWSGTINFTTINVTVNKPMAPVRSDTYGVYNPLFTTSVFNSISGSKTWGYSLWYIMSSNTLSSTGYILRTDANSDKLEGGSITTITDIDRNKVSWMSSTLSNSSSSYLNILDYKKVFSIGFITGQSYYVAVKHVATDGSESILSDWSLQFTTPVSPDKNILSTLNPAQVYDTYQGISAWISYNEYMQLGTRPFYYPIYGEINHLYFINYQSDEWKIASYLDYNGGVSPFKVTNYGSRFAFTMYDISRVQSELYNLYGLSAGVDYSWRFKSKLLARRKYGGESHGSNYENGYIDPSNGLFTTLDPGFIGNSTVGNFSYVSLPSNLGWSNEVVAVDEAYPTSLFNQLVDCLPYSMFSNELRNGYILLLESYFEISLKDGLDVQTIITFRKGGSYDNGLGAIGVKVKDHSPTFNTNYHVGVTDVHSTIYLYITPSDYFDIYSDYLLEHISFSDGRNWYSGYSVEYDNNRIVIGIKSPVEMGLSDAMLSGTATINGSFCNFTIDFLPYQNLTN